MSWKPSPTLAAIWDIFSTLCLLLMVGAFTGGEFRIDERSDEDDSPLGPGIPRGVNLWTGDWDSGTNPKGMYEL